MTNFLFKGLVLSMLCIFVTLACSDEDRTVRTKPIEKSEKKAFRILIFGRFPDRGIRGFGEGSLSPSARRKTQPGTLCKDRFRIPRDQWGNHRATSSVGGVSQIDWFLQAEPDYLILALGGNDGLRGVPVPETEENLSEILATAGKMKSPPYLRV